MIGEWPRKMLSREGWQERWSDTEGLEKGDTHVFYWRFGLIRTHSVGELVMYGVLIRGHIYIKSAPYHLTGYHGYSLPNKHHISPSKTSTRPGIFPRDTQIISAGFRRTLVCD